MKTKRLLILSVGLIFTLACIVSTGSEPTAVPPVVIPPTQAALPTYTPYPTFTLVAPPPAVLPSATVPPTSSAPRLTQDFLVAGKNNSGDTTNAAQLFTFDGQAGQTVEIVLVGVNNYQTFSIRDDQDKGLIGCNIDTQVICAIRNFKLPYTGIYYVRVDRTDTNSAPDLKQCEERFPSGGNKPRWCYMGGPYTITIKFQ